VNYKEAMDYIVSTNQYGSVPGLDNTRELLNRLDNPQDKLQFIHIGGTNGKGSTAAYISEILLESGYDVGRYISPTIIEYRERIQISNDDLWSYISEKAVAGYISKIKDKIGEMIEDGLPHPTSFEIETAMAFLEFVDKKCDFVVLEVGLGGRLDATNVIKNTVCAVLTSISIDHTQFLGDTLEKIAKEKAGIIKENSKVVSYEQKMDVLDVIKDACKDKNAPLSIANFSKLSNIKHSLEGVTFDYTVDSHFLFEKVRIRMLGENQPKNAALAMEVAIVLKKSGYAISKETIIKGIEKTLWRGRFDVLCKNPIFVVDGAHNKEAAGSLRDSLQLYFSGKRLIYIMGILSDKDYDGILEQTAVLADVIFTITPNNIRALPSEKLAEHARKCCSEVIDAQTIENGVKLAFEAVREGGVIVAFGSLSFLGEAFEIIGS
jgi:dihydrofolate synthase / folylpolyglutamate synthase